MKLRITVALLCKFLNLCFCHTGTMPCTADFHDVILFAVRAAHHHVIVYIGIQGGSQRTLCKEAVIKHIFPDLHSFQEFRIGKACLSVNRVVDLSWCDLIHNAHIDVAAGPAFFGADSNSGNHLSVRFGLLDNRI